MLPEFYRLDNPPYVPSPTPPSTPPPEAFDWYKYAVLGSLLSSAGAALGSAFRPAPPPQPLPAPAQFYKAPEITAPTSMQALIAAQQRRRG